MYVVSTWGTWTSPNLVDHTVRLEDGYCATCGTLHPVVQVTEHQINL